MQALYPPICHYCFHKNDCGVNGVQKVPAEVSTGLFNHSYRVKNEMLTFIADREIMKQDNITWEDLSKRYFSNVKSARNYIKNCIAR